MIRGSLALATPLVVVFAVGAPAAVGADEDAFRPFTTAPSAGRDTLTVDIDRDVWRDVARRRGRVTLERFPLPGADAVDLELERFHVTTPETRFVVGRALRPLDFDVSRIVMMRGRVAGVPGSHVYLAVSDHGSRGTIDLGTGRDRYAMASLDGAGRPLAAGQIGVSLVTPMGGSMLPEMCGTDTSGFMENASTPAAPRAASGTEGLPSGELRQIELAVETDYELFQIFGDLDATMAYVVELYGAISDIYVRDVNARVDLSFVRVWDDPDDLFNEESPLGPFRAYWEENEEGVHRDAAQFFSGRVNFPFGGQAWLGSLCTNRAYSVCGYGLGFYTDVVTPDVFNRDIIIPAHELGHNCAAPHTHGVGLDQCDDPTTTPRRGTIMAYCGQTFTGGEANMDMRFHTVIQAIVQDYLAGKEPICVVLDCNGNGVDDADDVDGGASDDDNGNGVPDECEDCNDNGMLDDDDIREGRSEDDNGNGVPDECEADCNQNGLPDDLDIANGLPDVNADGVPDECETDCNDNGMSDYTEILIDMSLDLDRDTKLDACEDCDDDGTTDLDALDHANNVWVTSLDRGNVREYLARTGTTSVISEEAGIAEGQDVLITADRRVLVSSLGDDRVIAFSLDGFDLGDFVAPGAGGLDGPTFMTTRPNGNLLVSSSLTDAVLEYDGTTGDFVSAFVASGTGGLDAPYGLVYGPNGNLFVGTDDGRVLEYDGATGGFVGVFVAMRAGGLRMVRGMMFLPNGNLLAVSYETNQVLEYDGESGGFVRQFNSGGTEDRLSLDQPWGIRLGPDGDVYVSRTHDHEDPPLRGGDIGDHSTGQGAEDLHLTNVRIYHFDVDSGWLQCAYVLGLNSGIEHPTGFAFVPDPGVDCNLNLVPDACDIASGRSLDENGNGVPDECEGDGCLGDLDGSGAVDFPDVLAVLAAWGNEGGAEDVDGDGLVGFQDLLLILSLWGPCA